MADYSMIWDGRTSEGAVGDAGAYDASEWQYLYATHLGIGLEKANRGTMKGVLNELAVTANSPTAMNVLVGTGAGFVQGIPFFNDSEATITINGNASGSTREDYIVMQADYAAQTVRLAVHEGTPGGGIPTLTQSTGIIWEVGLAVVSVASGTVAITSAMIADAREYANLPPNIASDVTNSSGATLGYGVVCTWLAAGGRAIERTTSEGSHSIAGIWESYALSGAQGRVITQGIYPVLCDESVAVGDLLETSTTTGQAQKAIAGGGTFARVLTANTGAGTRALCLINVPVQQFRPACVVSNTADQTVNNGATAALAFNQEHFDNAAMHDTVTNNSRITIRRAGLYEIKASFTIDNGNISAFVRLNGVTTILNLGGTGTVFFNGSRLYSFSASDYIELVITNSSGATRTITGNSGVSSPLFSVIQLIAA